LTEGSRELIPETRGSILEGTRFIKGISGNENNYRPKHKYLVKNPAIPIHSSDFVLSCAKLI